MNKRIVVLGILIVFIAIAVKLLINVCKNIKLAEFHKSAIVFIVDSSASNQKNLPEQVRYMKSLCTLLDPEDEIKILKVSENSYLIYEGTPANSKGITKAVEAFTQYNSKDYGTAYGEALKKAFDHCLNMKKEGYSPAIVMIGDLENEGAIEKQINWDTLPNNVKNVQEYVPELTMMFVYAHPEKLDMVKTKLGPVLGEKKLIITNETGLDKSNRKFLEAIGR
jgi:hypothetical protein